MTAVQTHETPPQAEHDLLRYAPAALVEVDLGGVVRAHNSLLSLWLGAPGEHPAGSLIGRNLIDWLTPVGRLHYETSVIPKLLQQQTVREVMFDVRNAHDELRSIMMTANLVHGSTTSGSRIFMVLVDSTDRNAFEHKLLSVSRAAEAAQRRLSFLQSATSRLAVATGLDDLGTVLADSAAEATQAAWSCSILLSPGATPTGLPGCTAAKMWGSAPALNFSVLDLVRTHDAEVFRNPEELRAAFPQYADDLDSFGIEAMNVTPITRSFDDGRPSVLLGAMLNWFRRSRSLDGDEVESLRALAVQAELVMEHLTLQDELRHRALHDPLTGLANRSLVESRLRQIIASAARSGEPCGVLFLDLDGFKAVNDQLGHHRGDEVLRTVAQRLNDVCRPSETISRLGGDEFVVIGERLDESAVTEIGHRIIEALQQPMFSEAVGCPISSSVGAIVWNPSSANGVPDEHDMLAAADAAMYDAKRAGKGQLVLRVW